MHSRTAYNYSLALVELAKEKGILPQIRAVAEDLLSALSLDELRTFLSHPRVPAAGKREVLLRLVSDKAPVEMRNFLNLLIDRAKEQLLVPIFESVIELTLQAEGFRIVELISALPLSETEQQEIRLNLEKSWQTKISIQYRVNPNLLGGIIIRSGDELIDGSLAGQFNALKELLIEKSTIGSTIF
jgi:F-type H+-transporting ATPase subunit delta